MRGVTGESLSLSLFLFVAVLENFRKGLCRREQGFFPLFTAGCVSSEGDPATILLQSLTSAVICSKKKNTFTAKRKGSLQDRGAYVRASENKRHGGWR